MGKEHLIYRLSDDQALVEGYKRSAVYDWARGYVFSINREAQNILLGTISPDENVASMLMSSGIKVSENPELIVQTETAKRNSVQAGECAPFCQPLQPCMPEQGCNPFALCIPEMSGCIPTAACQPDVLCVPGAGGNPCMPDGCSPMA